jgi:oxygen-independent coproporphyrinogen-3 oxidase
MGFNRASLGVQDFDPAVQKAVNRIQSVEETLAVIEACRAQRLPLGQRRPDLRLPGRTGRLRAHARHRHAGAPDRLAIYGYAHLPHMFRAQSRSRSAAAFGRGQARPAAPGDREAHRRRLPLHRHGPLRAAGGRLSRAQAAGSLHRNFMGYTTHAESDLVGFGVERDQPRRRHFSQNPRDLPGWEAAIDAGRLPVWRGMALDADDVLRAD